MCCGNSHDPREGLWKGTMTKFNEEKVFFLFEKSININLKEMLSLLYFLCFLEFICEYMLTVICTSWLKNLILTFLLSLSGRAW